MSVRGWRWAALASFALAACGHPPTPVAVLPPSTGVTDAGVPVGPRSGGTGEGPGQTAELACPLPVEHAGLVLARVGDVVITGCDVALAWEARTREGYHVVDSRAVLRDLVRDALLAAARPPRPRDPDVDRELAEALVRAEALAVLARERPGDAAVARYYAAHRDDFALPERVHLREVVLPTRAAAEAARRDLAAGAPFEDVVARTIDPAGRRDGGDLGFVARTGTPGVPGPVVDAGFALTEPGDVAPGDLRVVTEVPGRRHPRRLSAWHVVQLIQRLPAEEISLGQARRRIVQRMIRDRYVTLRRAARQGLEAAMRPEVERAIDGAALGRVRVAPR